MFKRGTSPVHTAANAAAWAVIGALLAAAILIANRLGFAGLFGLGVLTWLISLRASLDQEIPTWSVDVLRAASQTPRSAEGKAAAEAARQAASSPFRFYGRCGALLTAIGAIGFAWQLWWS